MMGSYARVPSWGEKPTDESEKSQTQLGDMLSGRLADVDIDSVEAVRAERKQE